MYKANYKVLFQTEKTITKQKQVQVMKFKRQNSQYTLYSNWSNTHFHFLLYSRFEWEPLELQKQMIPHFLALDVWLKISQAQLCSSIRGCHANFLVKNTLFKGEVAWQSLKELQSWAWDILSLTSRAKKWGIICLRSSSGSHSNLL